MVKGSAVQDLLGSHSGRLYRWLTGSEGVAVKILFDYFSGRMMVNGRALHSGDCFQVYHNDKWIDVRIELAGRDDWYLVGLPGVDPEGLEARFYE